MKTVLSFLLALLLLFPCAALGEEEASEPAATDEPVFLSLPLPLDFTGGYPVDEQYFEDENTYRDPTIRVEITYKDISEYIKGYKSRNAGAWIVDVRIGDASQLRTAAAEAFDKKTTLPVETIADRLNSVVAFNADYITRQDDGYVYRQGVLFKDKLKGKRDVLLIDEDGDFHPVHLPGRGELSDTVDGKKVYNSFCFGPILVENGEVCEKMPNFTYLRPENYYARLALCQVGPLHYKVILTTMEQDYTLGLQLKSFAQLCKDEGAVVAYNLDGGYSTTLYFHGKRLNSQKNVNFREVPDIFYFASAWDGGDAE